MSKIKIVIYNILMIIIVVLNIITCISYVNTIKDFNSKVKVEIESEQDVKKVIGLNDVELGLLKDIREQDIRKRFLIQIIITVVYTLWIRISYRGYRKRGNDVGARVLMYGALCISLSVVIGVGVLLANLEEINRYNQILYISKDMLIEE